MADNVAVTAGSGTTVAADEVSDATLGSCKVQFVKIMDGTLDGTTKAAVSANGLEVDVQASALPTGAATSAKQDTGNSSVASIDGKITACNTGAVVLAAGSAAIGKLAANTGVDIGDVDVTSVSGNVTVVQGTSSNLKCTEANSADIKSGVDSSVIHLAAIVNAISGSEIQVDVISMPTTTVQATNLDIRDLSSASDSVAAVCTNAGTFAVQEGNSAAIKTALEIIDDWDSSDTCKVSDAGGSLTVDGAVTANPSKLATTDDADFVKKYYTNAGAVTDGIVWSPAAGKRWYITDMIVNVSAAATVTLEDDKAGGDDPVLKCELAANGGFRKRFGTPLASGEDAADLIVTTSAGNIYITITGYEV